MTTGNNATESTRNAAKEPRDERLPYERPQVTKEPPVTRVTLFSGGGTTTTGFTTP